MTCTKCGSHSFFLDTEDGPNCWACRKPYAAPWPPEEAPSQLKAERFSPVVRRWAVELSYRIGVHATAREFGVGDNTIYTWRGLERE